MTLRKAGANWVEGDRFYDRKSELEALTERVHDGAHTLLTAQRRMGKTSLVRELLRRLTHEGQFETIFVDLEATDTPAQAIAEIGDQSMSAQGIRRLLKSMSANLFNGVVDRVKKLTVTQGDGQLGVELRDAIDAGNWQQKGDAIFAALAANRRPVVLAIDELPILVNKLLKGDDYRITPERKQAAAEFMSWLRKNGQMHRGRIRMILSGSVGLAPILQQADLIAQINIFSSFDLKPWDEKTAMNCLAELAENYELVLPDAVRHDMCRRLGCQVPHHVQQFFDVLHEYLRRVGRRTATLEDVEHVYVSEMLGARGPTGLKYYESRLKMVLGTELYQLAIDLLTEAATDSGRLRSTAINPYHEHFVAPAEVDPAPVTYVLSVLEHDGYLERQGDDYRFVSDLLEEWWRVHHGRRFVPIAQR